MATTPAPTPAPVAAKPQPMFIPSPMPLYAKPQNFGMMGMKDGRPVDYDSNYPNGAGRHDYEQAQAYRDWLNGLNRQAPAAPKSTIPLTDVSQYQAGTPAAPVQAGYASNYYAPQLRGAGPPPVPGPLAGGSSILADFLARFKQQQGIGGLGGLGGMPNGMG